MRDPERWSVETQQIRARSQHELLKREAGSATASGLLGEIGAIVGWIVTLPWRALRWIGSKVAREERLGDD